jgi:O-antigen/teichoic acid export membrane protein
MATAVPPAAAPTSRASFIVRNVTSSWAVLLVNTLISFLLAPLVVSSLGSVYYGVWSLLMQFTGYLWLFDFGVRESVIKYVAQYEASGERDKLEITVRTAIAVYSLVTLVAMLAVAVMVAALPHVFNIPPDAVSTARIAAFVTGTTVAQSFLTNVFVGVLMGLQRIYLVSRMGIVFSLARAAGTYLLLTNGFGLVGLSLLHLALSLANAGLVVHYCRHYLPDLPLAPTRPERPEVVKLFNYGKYVLLANVGDKIVFATDALVIGAFLPIAALTPYAIAGTLIQNMRQVVMAMAQIFNPLTSSLRAEGGARVVQPVLQSGARAAMTIGVPICIGFITLGERFVSLWMGDEHAAMAGRVMTVLSAGYLVGLPYYTISGVLYGLGEHRVVAVLRIVEGAINLLCSIVLINLVGLVGVAIGTAIPHVVIVGWALPRALPKLFPMNLRDYYLAVYGRTLLAAVPFAVATWLIATVVRPATLASFLAWGVASLAAYAAPVWFISMTDDERAHLRRMAGGRKPGKAAGPASVAGLKEHVE